MTWTWLTRADISPHAYPDVYYVVAETCSLPGLEDEDAMASELEAEAIGLPEIVGEAFSEADLSAEDFGFPAFDAEVLEIVELSSESLLTGG